MLEVIPEGIHLMFMCDDLSKRIYQAVHQKTEGKKKQIKC